MKVDVAGCISQLLYEHDAVIIPGFGALVSAYKPASIDYVQGIIHPPSKQLSFNDQMIANDGLLHTALQNQYSLSLEEAREAVESFVSEARQKLQEREIIIFPRVGRIYYDFENNLQFLQDTTNFNRDVFGLPLVQFFPILRSREHTEKEGLPSSGMGERSKPSLLEGRLIPLIIPILFAIAITIVGVSIYLSQQRSKMIDDIQRLPTELRLNENPESARNRDGLSRKDENTVRNGFDLDALSGGSEPEAETDLPERKSEAVREVPIDTEEPTLGPNQHECVIIIGQFREKNGVSKRVSEIYEIGFNAYTAPNPKNGLTMVGVQFIYEDPQDVNKALRYLRRRFESSAWILKPRSFKG